MIVCEECERKRFKKVLADADKAMERFYNKLRRKKNGDVGKRSK